MSMPEHYEHLQQAAADATGDELKRIEKMLEQIWSTLSDEQRAKLTPPKLHEDDDGATIAP